MLLYKFQSEIMSEIPKTPRRGEIVAQFPTCCIAVLPACGCPDRPARPVTATSCRLKIGDTAGWKPALRGTGLTSSTTLFKLPVVVCFCIDLIPRRSTTTPRCSTPSQLYAQCASVVASRHFCARISIPLPNAYSKPFGFTSDFGAIILGPWMNQPLRVLHPGFHNLRAVRIFAMR